MRRVVASRYVTSLPEGGSLPAVVDTEDGLFVVKFRGAGQGAKALIAEILVAGFAKALELPVPEVVIVDLDESFGRSERDPEIRDILAGSVGANVGLRYLRGAFNFDGAADDVSEELASRVLWLDCFATNIDRTPRNPNLLWFEDSLWLIDHGAAVYFHHGWSPESPPDPQAAFVGTGDHVLLRRATELEAADRWARQQLEGDVVREIVADVPDELLADRPPGVELPFGTPGATRTAYVEYFEARLARSRGFVDAALEAQAASPDEQRKEYRR
ncbi:MAG: HipA family kinase [Acidobacteriota bacterium]